VTDIPTPSAITVGNMFGTGLVGAIEYFEQKYGPSAAHAVITKISPRFRHLVKPNVPVLGILGAKKYPYAFVGELVRAMASAVKATDEDAFIREIASAGFDRTLNTVARLLMRSLVSPAMVAARSPELWRLFHDSGRLTITELSDRHYLSQIDSWIGHDVVVCKLGVEAGRRVVERTGVTHVEARREKCIAWGHDVCVTRVRWQS
jgi:hypothetical protein